MNRMLRLARRGPLPLADCPAEAVAEEEEEKEEEEEEALPLNRAPHWTRWQKSFQ